MSPVAASLYVAAPACVLFLGWLGWQLVDILILGPRTERANLQDQVRRLTDQRDACLEEAKRERLRAWKAEADLRRAQSDLAYARELEAKSLEAGELARAKLAEAIDLAEWIEAFCSGQGLLEPAGAASTIVNLLSPPSKPPKPEPLGL